LISGFYVNYGVIKPLVKVSCTVFHEKQLMCKSARDYSPEHREDALFFTGGQTQEAKALTVNL